MQLACVAAGWSQRECNRVVFQQPERVFTEAGSSRDRSSGAWCRSGQLTERAGWLWYSPQHACEEDTDQAFDCSLWCVAPTASGGRARAGPSGHG